MATKSAKNTIAAEARVERADLGALWPGDGQAGALGSVRRTLKGLATTG